jgi:hypothetical protein
MHVSADQLKPNPILLVLGNQKGHPSSALADHDVFFLYSFSLSLLPVYMLISAVLP